VLEDLSDRTEVQVKQLTTLLSEKGRELQDRIFQADHQIEKIQEMMKKSLEVSEIFQDKIPHDEIIERRNTIKYVKAAQMANEGQNADDIVNELAIPRNEAEFIVKVNKDKLMFAPDRLPEWAKNKLPEFTDEEREQLIPPSRRREALSKADDFPEMEEKDEQGENFDAMGSRELERAFEEIVMSTRSLDRVNEEFKKSVKEAEEEIPEEDVFVEGNAAEETEEVQSAEKPFERVDITQNLS
jgi:hypothetical protein